MFTANVVVYGQIKEKGRKKKVNCIESENVFVINFPG